MKQKFKTIDEYIHSFPRLTQDKLEELRNIIKNKVPKAEEGIKYGMPTFILNGNLVYFGGFKHHIGFYPVPTEKEEFKKDFAPYKTGKGSIQFPLDKPLPKTLITKIINYRIKELKRKKSL